MGFCFDLVFYDPEVRALQFVQVVVQCRYTLFQTFAFPNFSDDLEGFAGRVTGVSLEDLPVVKHTLREGLTTSVTAQVSCET